MQLDSSHLTVRFRCVMPVSTNSFEPLASGRDEEWAAEVSAVTSLEAMYQILHSSLWSYKRLHTTFLHYAINLTLMCKIRVLLLGPREDPLKPNAEKHLNDAVQLQCSVCIILNQWPHFAKNGAKWKNKRTSQIISKKNKFRRQAHTCKYTHLGFLEKESTFHISNTLFSLVKQCTGVLFTFSGQKAHGCGNR